MCEPLNSDLCLWYGLYLQTVSLLIYVEWWINCSHFEQSLAVAKRGSCLKVLIALHNVSSVDKNTIVSLCSRHSSLLWSLSSLINIHCCNHE